MRTTDHYPLEHRLAQHKRPEWDRACLGESTVSPFHLCTCRVVTVSRNSAGHGFQDTRRGTQGRGVGRGDTVALVSGGHCHGSAVVEADQA